VRKTMGLYSPFSEKEAEENTNSKLVEIKYWAHLYRKFDKFIEL
jgi:hypothetical protein